MLMLRFEREPALLSADDVSHSSKRPLFDLCSTLPGAISERASADMMLASLPAIEPRI